MENAELKAYVYDIQGFSVQDGPGIRTTAFLKGCVLRCPWCHSPESQAFYPQLSWMSMRCLGTAQCDERCIRACDKGAVVRGELRNDAKTGAPLQMVRIDRSVCDDCGACTEVCHVHALEMCGREYTVRELTERLLKDRKFFKNGGGVTISGGECLCQADYTAAVLKSLKEEGINTAVDTTGCVPWEAVEKVLPYTDLFLYDIKHMDSAKHRAVVGKPNELILENCRKIACAGGKMQIRIPVIPLFNHDEDTIRKTAAFCQTLGDAVVSVQLLPYHSYGASKLQRISDQKAFVATPPSDEYMEHLKKVMEEYGLTVTIH